MNLISPQMHVDRVRNLTNGSDFLRSGSKSNAELIQYLAALIQSYQSCTKREYSDYGFNPNFSSPLRELAAALSVAGPPCIKQSYDTPHVSEDQSQLNNSSFNMLEFASYLDQVVRIFAKTNSLDTLPTTLFREQVLSHIQNPGYANMMYENKRTLIETQPLVKLTLEIEELSRKLSDPNYHHLCLFDVDGVLRDRSSGESCNIDTKLNERLLCLSKYNLPRTNIDAAFITGRSGREVRSSNLPYQSIPTFCNFGHQRLDTDGRYDAYPGSINSELEEVTRRKADAMRVVAQEFRRGIQYNSCRVDDACSGMVGLIMNPGYAMSDQIKSRVAQLADDDWSFHDRGHALWLEHRDFKLGRYSVLRDIFGEVKRNEKPLRVYCFEADLRGELLMQALQREQSKLDLAELCHVPIGHRIEGDSEYGLSSHEAVEALLADLVELN